MSDVQSGKPLLIMAEDVEGEAHLIHQTCWFRLRRLRAYYVIYAPDDTVTSIAYSTIMRAPPNPTDAGSRGPETMRCKTSVR